MLYRFQSKYRDPVRHGHVRIETKTKKVISTTQAQNQVKNAFTHDSSTESFVSVCYVSAFKIIFNMLRPDELIPLQGRLPRIMWEIIFFTIADLTRRPSVSPATYILLALTTATTAVVDIFLWAPIFGVAAKFETCKGGFFSRRYQCQRDYVKGFGRLMVSTQSLCTGIVYLVAAIHAWSVLTAVRDEQKLQQQIRAMEIAASRQGDLS